MANFPSDLFNAGGLNNQIGAAANRLYISSRGTTPYFDPPNAPIPLARAPAGNIAISDGRSGTPMLAFFAGTSLAAPQWGHANATLTQQVNNRALPAHEIDWPSIIESEIPGGLAIGIGQEWFEKCHIFPGNLNLGNVLSTQIRTLELFNAFRRPREPVTWQTFVNNAGAGVTITNLPALPFVIESFDSFIANVQVSTNGPPAINGTLDFAFSAPTAATFMVPITGSRITIFQYRPQAPITENLTFKTDILRLNDGSEQRIKLREAPRQNIKMLVRVKDDIERDQINAVLFDWQSRVFGIPIWWEQKPLGAPMAINDVLIVVDTADIDIRVDSLVMLYDGPFNSEALEVLSFTANDITLKSGVSQAFNAVNTVVVPVRTGYTKPQMNNRRFAIGPADYQMDFQTLDNVDLASIGAFTTFQGVGQSVAKPVLDGLNFMSGATIGEGNRRRVIKLDTETGPQIQFSPWAKGKPLYQFSFDAESFAEIWAWRQLVHYLRGSQLSFYVPTGRRDIRPIVDIGTGSSAIDFQNYGFTSFISGITPRSDIRILRIDGTQSLHQITGSIEIDSLTERLNITPPVVPALPIAEVDRIDIMTLSRITDDAVKIEHSRPGEANISFKLIGVTA